MSRFAGVTTNNWSTAGAWNQITNTPTIHTSTNINISTTNLFTATFTAPNTTNACTGVALYLVTANTSGGDITVTLQESTVDTAATVTVASSTLTNSGTWIYFKFATPYVFTTTGAGAYRFKIVNSSSSNLPVGAADSGGANLAYIATDDRTGPPASTDDIWIFGNNGANSITITIDSDQTIGSGAASGNDTLRSINHSINVGERGILAWATGSSVTLTNTGAVFIYRGGTHLMQPASSSVVSTFVMAQNGTDNNFRYHSQGTTTLQGSPKSSTTLWKTTLASGTGTAADPAIMADAVDWEVGDEIVVGSTGTVSQTEYRFIITKNSATSYVWSSTKGGAEAALTHAHSSSARVVNIERNVILKTDNTADPTYWFLTFQGSGILDADWIRGENLGTFGLYLGNASPTNNCDYSVAYNATVGGYVWTAGSQVITHTGLVAIGKAGGGNGFNIGAVDKTLVDCFAFDFTLGNGFTTSGSMSNMTFTRCCSIGNLRNWLLSSTFNMTFNDCEAQASSLVGLWLQGSNAKVTFNNYLSGTKGSVSIDILITASTYQDVLFNSSTLSSATFITGYTGLTAGSEIKFHTLSGTTNNHVWYTPYGIARSTGSGLTDTTVRTANSLGVRIAPENNTTGFSWQFFILAPASSIINFFCYAQKNTAFGTSTAKVELFLPGSTTADDTFTLSNDTGSWQAVSLSANYTSSINGLATVKITGITSTSAAYLYIDDIFNADTSNAAKLAAIDVWANGQPSPLITVLAVTAADVWTFSTTELTTANTTGKKLVDGLTKGQFVGLK